MPTKNRKRNAKGHFLKGGSSSTAIATRPKTRTVTKTVNKYRTRSAPKAARRGRSRKSGGGGTPKLTHIAGAALGLAYLFGPKGPSMLVTNANKLPGAKTFGAPATAGLACLAVDRFVRPNKWLKLAGVAGLVLAAANIGTKGTEFKFVGDGDDVADYDVGDDDVGDDDVGDDDVGDDDVGNDDD